MRWIEGGMEDGRVGWMDEGMDRWMEVKCSEPSSRGIVRLEAAAGQQEEEINGDKVAVRSADAE